MLPTWVRRNIILTAVLSFTISALCQSVQYTVIPITSPFDPSHTVIGNDINKAGVLPLTDIYQGQFQAFVWKAGEGIPLSLLGGSCSGAFGINNAGHIVGGACPPGETLPHAYLNRSGNTQDLGTFGGVSAAGIAVNRRDQITGNYAMSDGTEHAFFWTRRGWADLGGLGGSFTYAAHLNDAAVITGQSDISNNPDPVFGIPPFHGFQWSGGVLVDFGQIFASNFNYGNSINDAGMIAGSADLAGDVGAHAIVWNQGLVQDLTPYGNLTAWGIDINTQGDVVGSWGYVDGNPADGPPVNVMLCPCYAVVWHNGQATFLNDVVPPEWNLWLGLAINDKGEILARGQQNGERLVTVLLKPIKHDAFQNFELGIRVQTRSYSANAPKMLRRDHNGSLDEIH